MEPLLLNFSVVLSILFFPYGLNFYYLMRRAEEYKLPKVESRKKPPVTVQLPVFNERYVVERLVNACVQMADNYGRDLVQILILDDSTDDTTIISEQAARKYRSLGYDIDMIHRDNRLGFKAGALQNALKYTKYQFMAIFDADFIPPKDFLGKTMPYFEDPRLALAQCRWTHLNRDYNFLTKAIAIGYDGHHIIEQAGRCAGGFLMNFNGSAGIIRREALEEAGGWEADTLAEDLDASYRIQLQGWKAIYIRSINCPAEVPPTVPSMKRQQSRWACGSIRTFRKLSPRILAKKSLSLGQKIQGLIHLSYYAVHPLMFMAFAVALVAAFLDIRLVKLATLAFPEPRIAPDIPTWLNFIPYLQILVQSAWDYFISMPHWIVLNAAIFFCAISMWVFYAKALRLQGIRVRSQAKALAALGLVGFGISLSNTVAVVRGLIGGGPGIFARTPKYKIEKQSDTWKDKKYQVAVDKIIALEIALAIVGIVAMVVAYFKMNLGIIPILLLYTVAYSFIAGANITQGRRELST